MNNYPIGTGHRERLRQQFLSHSGEMSETKVLELLLTFAIPRRDVAPLANALINRFDNVANILAASYDQLIDLPDVGEQTALLLKIIQWFAQHSCATDNLPEQNTLETTEQKQLFDLQTGSDDTNIEDKLDQLHMFANDEIGNSIEFIPQAASFESYASFKQYLEERLPYNSSSTRHRRARYILHRFYPDNRINIPLTYFVSHCSTRSDLQTVIFYHVLKAEPIAAKVADEFIYPALPLGKVEREDMREFILRYLPNSSASSQKNALRSIFTTYDLLESSQREGDTLFLRVHNGSSDAFLYILTSEYPNAGMYSFNDLENGPLRKWLLWDRDWMWHQLYVLRDMGIITKISEIDSIRQFTLAYEQQESLKKYFENGQ